MKIKSRIEWRREAKEKYYELYYSYDFMWFLPENIKPIRDKIITYISH